MGARWGYFEDTVRLAVALRRALAARGVPQSIYVDNGSAFVDAALKRAAAKLAIRIIHSMPGRPQGRGKIERFFQTVRGQFLVEIGDGSGIANLETLNRFFVAWVETVYHRRSHSETGQPPLDRWLAGAPFAQPTTQQLHEAFLWQEHRQVRKTATVSLLGNAYCVDPVLVGRRVELVFDPFDLSHIEVRHNGKPMGLATAQVIGRHAHPKARPEHVDPAPPAAQTGIDYLRLVAAAHDIADARRIDYRAVTGPPPDGPGPATDVPGGDQATP
jgi:putative transposase